MLSVMICIIQLVLGRWYRSEEHTSELQSRSDLVCRLLLEKKKNTNHEQLEQTVAHYLDDRVDGLFLVDELNTLYRPGEKKLPEQRNGQNRERKKSGFAHRRLAS